MEFGRATIQAAAAASTKSYVPYNHTDACSLSRWTPRESFRFMYARAWHKVENFYSDLVRNGNGASSLRSLFSAPEQSCQSNDTIESLHGNDDIFFKSEPAKGRTGRWERVTFKIILSYHGGSFDGWQKQPGLNTVQELVERSLGRFVDEKKAMKLAEKSLPIEGCAVVAGRTDKGVSALQQVCSFYTWRKDVKSGDIQDAINEAVRGKAKVLHVSEVSRAFHPNFSAKWRRYLYIFPLEHGANIDCYNRTASKTSNELEDEEMNMQCGDGSTSVGMPFGSEEVSVTDAERKPSNFDVSKVDQLIQQLQGKSLSYRIFARDTKASRSIGPPTDCYMFHARAVETKLPYVDKEYGGLRVMSVELVANRFLRKMVRVLVATAIREAAADADTDVLLKLMDATCRRASAPPAPSEGLCLVDVGYEEFKKENCFIH